MSNNPAPKRGSRVFLILVVVGVLEAVLQVVLITQSPTNIFFYAAAVIGLALAVVGFLNYSKNKRL